MAFFGRRIRRVCVTTSPASLIEQSRVYAETFTATIELTGAPFVLQHNLNTEDIIIQFRNLDTGELEELYVDNDQSDANKLTISSTSSGRYRVMIISLEANTETEITDVEIVNRLNLLEAFQLDTEELSQQVDKRIVDLETSKANADSLILNHSVQISQLLADVALVKNHLGL